MEKIVTALRDEGVDFKSLLNEKSKSHDGLSALERLTYPTHNDAHAAIGGPRLGCGQWQYPLSAFRHHYTKTLDALDVLLREGANTRGFNIATEFGAGSFQWWPLLHFVCFRYPDEGFGGELIRRLVKTSEGGAAVNETCKWTVYDESYETTPLHLAIMFGGDWTPDTLFSDLNPIACLAWGGADLIAVDGCGRTPLELALLCNNGGAMVTLLHLGAPLPEMNNLVCVNTRHHLQWGLAHGHKKLDSTRPEGAPETKKEEDEKDAAKCHRSTWMVDGKIPVTRDMLELVQKLHSGHVQHHRDPDDDSSPTPHPKGPQHDVADEGSSDGGGGGGSGGGGGGGDGTALHPIEPHSKWTCGVCDVALGHPQMFHSRFLYRKTQRAKARANGSYGSWEDAAEGVALGSALGTLGGLAAGAAFGAL